MELWIRSQDKTKLEQAYSLYILEINDEKYVIENNDSHLGEYKTEERALEVLDDIESLLCGNTSSGGVVKARGIRSEYAQNLIYEMPID